MTKSGPQLSTSPLIFYNNKHYVGGLDEFLDLASMKYAFVPSAKVDWANQADVAFRKYCNDSGPDFCYLDVSIGSKALDRIIIELFKDVCPKTCENFKVLCNGTGPMVDTTPLHYEGTEFHRIVPGGWIQGGGK